MNQTQKTSLVVLALLVVLGAITYFTWGTSQNTLVEDTSATSTETGVNGTNGSAAQNGGTAGQAGAGTGTTAPAGLTDAQIVQMIASAKISVPQTGVDVALTGGQGFIH